MLILVKIIINNNTKIELSETSNVKLRNSVWNLFLPPLNPLFLGRSAATRNLYALGRPSSQPRRFLSAPLRFAPFEMTCCRVILFLNKATGFLAHSGRRNRTSFNRRQNLFEDGFTAKGQHFAGGGFRKGRLGDVDALVDQQDKVAAAGLAHLF